MKRIKYLTAVLLTVALLAGCGGGGDSSVVDMTVYSSTMRYSQLVDMLYENPEEYLGKEIKVCGSFDIYHSDKTGEDLLFCVVLDSTACCSEEIEFVLAEGQSYPEDCPEPDEWVTVQGTFAEFDAGGGSAGYRLENTWIVPG